MSSGKDQGRGKQRLAAALAWLWLLPALACNLPRAARPELEWIPVASGTPAGLGGAGSSLPGELIPTAGPPVRGAWGFAGLERLTEFPPASAAWEPLHTPAGRLLYLAQPGDTLAALAGRFGVEPGRIHGAQGPAGGGLPAADRLLPAGTQLEIENEELWSLPGYALLPDSEIVYGPAAADFSAAEYIQTAGGFLAGYSEPVDGEVLSGAQIVERVALDTSTNPRLLLAFLEFRAGWVLGTPREPVDTVFPIGFGSEAYRGLYPELILTARQLSLGLYGWRSGKLTTLDFPLGGSARLDPRVNAGTAAVSVLVSKLYKQASFGAALYGPEGFVAFYHWMFGSPWERAAAYEPVYPAGFLAELPPLELPFAAGERWNLTGGPHMDWGSASPRGAVDFAPAGERSGCYVSARWATAAAAGKVLRSERGMLLLDLDGDGKEQTGWVLLYLHLADEGRAAVGTAVAPDQPLGHPSCEGGTATGTHVHLARKYNGEWVGVGPETPLVLSGWRVEADELPYLGRLVSPSGAVVSAKSDGSSTSLIVR